MLGTETFNGLLGLHQSDCSHCYLPKGQAKVKLDFCKLRQPWPWYATGSGGTEGNVSSANKRLWDTTSASGTT